MRSHVDKAFRIIAALALALGPALVLVSGAVWAASMYASSYNPGYQYVANPDNILGVTDGLAACGDGGGNFAIVVQFSEYVTLDEADILTIVSSGFDQINSGVILVTDAGNQQLIEDQAITGTYTLEEWSGLELQGVYIAAGNNGTGNCVDSVFFGDGEVMTPTPTAAPTSTPFAVPTQVCIPADQYPTAVPTLAARTPTVFPPIVTPTPGGTPVPTATPSATPSPTALPYLGDTAKFDNGLSPWTVTGSSGGSWSVAINGPDTLPGVASFYSNAVASSLGVHQALTYTLGFNSSALILPTSVTFPVRLTGNIRTSSIYPGAQAYLAAYYLDDAFFDPIWQTTSARWVRFGSLIPIQAAWGQFDFRLDVPVIGSLSPTTSALALEVVMVDATFTHPQIEAYADDLRIVAGNLSAVLNSYPVCPTGPGYLPTPQTKFCPVDLRDVDVFSECRQPTDVLNVGAWISYLWCSVSTYFEFGDANQQQITDLTARQSLNEPIGTMIELPGVVGVFGGKVEEYKVRYSSTYRRSINWEKMFDTQAISNLSGMPVPGPAAPAPTCDLGEVMLTDTDRALACAIVGFMVTSELTPVIQFLIDLAGLLLVITYVWRTWLAKNG